MARAAGVDDGGNAGAYAKNIWIDAESAEPFHKMQVNVDKSRCDDLILDVDLRPTILRKVDADRVYLAVAHTNVKDSILVADGINQSATLQKKLGGLFVHDLKLSSRAARVAVGQS
jgi:hypothetical protein